MISMSKKAIIHLLTRALGNPVTAHLSLIFSRIKFGCSVIATVEASTSPLIISSRMTASRIISVLSTSVSRIYVSSSWWVYSAWEHHWICTIRLWVSYFNYLDSYYLHMVGQNMVSPEMGHKKAFRSPFVKITIDSGGRQLY